MFQAGAYLKRLSCAEEGGKAVFISKRTENNTIGKRAALGSNSLPLVIRRLKRDKPAQIALGVFLIICFACIFAPFVTRWSYSEINISRILEYPSSDHILGTDSLGRDMFARLLYGGRVTLRISSLSTLLAAAAGCFLGLMAGYAGSRLDLLITSVLDILSAIPSILLAVVIDIVFGWGRGYFLYAIAIAAVPQFAHLVRACVMNMIKSEYIEAARALGVGKLRIMFRHVLRNIISPLAIRFASCFAEAILSCTIMGYLSIDIKPPAPEWGVIVHSGRTYIWKQPLLIVFPCAVIAITIISVNIFSDGLRDALDPRE